MTTRKNWIRKLLSCLLAFSFILAIGNVDAAEVQTSSKKAAWEKAVSLQEIIIRDVPECSWTSETTCSDAFPLYDLDGAVNGYVFEFQNGNTAAGFIQIDLTTGTALLDSYCFSGVHTAKTMIAQTGVSRSNAPIIYLGGYNYLQEQNEATKSGIKTYYDLFSGEKITNDSESFDILENQYASFVSKKQTVQNTNTSRGMYTVTKFVDGYAALGWETYTSINDGTNKCAPIAITNICKYWRFCKGKSSIYPSTAFTYMTVRDLMGTFDDDGASMSAVQPAWINYVESRGYTAKSYTMSSSLTFDTCRTFIDNNRPFLYNCGYRAAGSTYSRNHAVAVFGYQYIDIENTLIIADACGSTVVYKTWSSFSDTNFVPHNSCVIPY